MRRIICGLGDEIIEVNGESFDNLTHHEAAAAIKKHKKGAASLRILVARQKTTKSQRRFYRSTLPSYPTVIIVLISNCSRFVCVMINNRTRSLC